MKKGKSAALAALLVLCMAAVTTSCGKSEGGGADSGGPTKFNWFISIEGFASSFDLWETSPTLQEIVATTGTLPIVAASTGTGVDKLNLMIATDDFPDLLTLTVSSNFKQKLVDLGVIWDIEEVMAKYEPGFSDEIPEVVKLWHRDIDNGKLYGTPGWPVPDWQYEARHNWGMAGFQVRKDA